MENLSDIKVIKKTLSSFGFKFSKSLGQNFIVDSSVCPKMAENSTENKNSGVIEIGPGIGVLTIELAKRFKKVVSVEIDKRLIPILKETTAEFENVKIINRDILKTDLKKLIETEFKDFDEINVCANLPYYITSEVIMYILENEEIKVNSLVLMIQKEAAERICAQPGSRQSGAISLAVRYYGEPEILFSVNRGCFIPMPNVDSCVIKINLKKLNSKIIKDKTRFFKVVKAAFSQRRKNIANSLGSGLGKNKDEIKNILNSAGINPNFRAEQLTFEDFSKIVNLL
ncbi:MAG: 16S rRNA (adenine(1518)-N(6)/adenine(1519)-N(6))-dimethyltransferase RsmA [Clostridia bacterium]|nr:16S rRNA (adenine(1518)-N(6)/adenine(1519)-N(6))-dimethyltransferase RsmA [Clostridia bacterium]